VSDCLLPFPFSQILVALSDFGGGFFLILRSEKLRSSPAWFTDIPRSNTAKSASVDTEEFLRKTLHICSNWIISLHL
jgi:hypothetical protein